MKSNFVLRNLSLLAALVAAFGGIDAVAGDANEIWLRRIFVPADDLAVWPTEGKTYLPVDRTRLEQFMRPAQDDRVALAAIASYRVKVAPDGSVTGTLLLKPAQSEAKTKQSEAKAEQSEAKAEQSQAIAEQGEAKTDLAWLPISASGVRLIEARDLATGDKVPLGYSNHLGEQLDTSAKPAPRLLCQCTAPIEISWSTTLQRVAENIRSVSLPATNALTVDIEVEYPVGYRIDSYSGQLVTSVDETSSGWNAKLAVAPTTQLALRLVDTESAATPASVVVPMRETIEHRLSLVGDRITARFEIDDAPEGDESLVLDIPEKLTVTAVSIDGVPIEFRQSSSASPGRIVATFPASAERSPRRVCVVEAWVPLPLGQSLELPQPVPRGVVWTEGKIIVEQDDSIRISDTRGESAVPATGGEGVANQSIWQKVTQSGRCIVLAQMQLPRLESDLCHRVVLSGSGTDAETIWKIDSLDLRLPPQIEAQVGDDWIIESVTTEPSSGLRDWYVDEFAGKRRLVLQFSGSLADKVAFDRAPYEAPVVAPDEAPFAEVDDKCVVRITSRLGKSARAEWLPLDRLLPVELIASTAQNQLLGVTSFEGFEIQIAGSIPTLTPDDLSTRQLALFGDGLPAKVINLDESLRGGSVHIDSKKSQLRSKIVQQITSLDNTWQSRYDIECEPAQGPIDRCEVYFSRPIDPAARWFDADSQSSLRAEVVAPDEYAKRQLPSDGQLWRVRLAKPTETVARLGIVLPESEVAKWSVPLAAVLGTSATQATVGLASDGLKSIAYLPQELSRATNMLRRDQLAGGDEIARWTYDPQLIVSSNQQQSPSLQLSHERQSPVTPPVVVAEARLESRYAPYRPSLHAYSATIRHRSAATLTCQLPAQAQSIRYRIGDQAIVVADGTSTLTLRLSPEQRESTIVVELELPDSGALLGSTLLAPWPQIDAPLLDSEWIIVLPTTLSVRGHTPGSFVESTKMSLLPTWPLIATAAAIDSDEVADQRAWHTTSLRRLGGPVASVRIDDSRHESLIGLMALAGAMLAGFYLSTSIRWWTCALGCVLLITFVAPREPATMGAYAAIGLLLGAGWRWRSWVTPVAPVASIAIVLLAVASPATSLAEPPDMEKVLIPSDASGAAADKRVFVSPRLLKMIGQSEQQRSQQGPDFLVESLRLKVDLAGTGGVAVMTSWTIDLASYRSDCQVVLPLDRGQAKWQPTARVSGIPAPIAWNAENNEMSFVVPEPGNYRVVFQASQAVAINDGRASVTCSLPPVPRASATINSPSTLRELRVNGVATAQNAVAGGYSVELPLKTAGQVDFSWQATDALSPPTSSARATVTSLVQVTGDSTTIDMQLSLTAYDATRPLLIPLATPATAVLVANAATNVIEKPLGIDADGNVVINADDVIAAMKGERPLRVRLTIERNQPVGLIVLPVRQLPVGCRGSHLIGVICEDSLDASLKNVATSVALIDADDFLETRGGDFDLSPRLRFAANVSDVTQPIQLAVTPRSVLSGTEETIRLFCQPRSCKIRYQTDFSEPSWPRLRQVFRVSPDTIIDHVTASSSSGALPLSFHRVSETRLVVLFERPVEQAYRLRIEATAEFADGSHFSLPRLAALGNASMSQRVVLYCDPSLLVEVPDIEGITKLGESTLTTPAEWVAYPVGSYRVDAAVSMSVPLKLSSNQLRYRVQNLHRIEAGSTPWQVENLAVVDVMKGQLVELTVELPADVAGPFDVEPPAYVNVEQQPASDTQRVKLRFPQAMAPESSHLIRIRYAAPASSTGGVDVRLPRYVGARGTSHWLATPHESTLTGNWNFRGTQAVELPTTLAARCDPQLWDIAKIAAPGRFSAQWRSTSTVETTIRLASAHHRATFDAVGSVKLQSRLLLYPSIHEECQIAISSRQELIALRVDGHPTLVEQTTDGPYLLSLGPASLPHVIDIETLESVDKLNSKVTNIEAPQLVGDHTNSTMAASLWSIENGSTEARWQPVDATRVSPRDRATVLLSRWVDASNEIASGTARQPSRSTTAWKDWWAEQTFRLQQQLQSTTRVADDKAALVSQLDDQNDSNSLVAAAEKLETQLTSEELLATLRGTEMANEDYTTYSVAGAQLRVAHSVPRELQKVENAKWSGVLVVVFVVGLVMCKPVAAWLTDRPYLLLAFVGVGLWALLSPVWLGIAIVVAALIAWGRTARGQVGNPRASAAL